MTILKRLGICLEPRRHNKDNTLKTHKTIAFNRDAFLNLPTPVNKSDELSDTV